MLSLFRQLARRSRDRAPLIAIVTAIAALVLWSGTLSAQRGRGGEGAKSLYGDYKHLNPIVAKMAEGKPFIGTNVAASDLTLSNCHSMARLDFDYVYIDMEHGPFDMTKLADCAAFMVDKAEAVRRGSVAPKVALLARFPPPGRAMDSNDWVIKQALDLGLMGVIGNTIDNADQARRMVQYMRYPQQRTSKFLAPPGLRGYSPTLANWVWGISGVEYERRADVYPLNPDGELVAIPMIESVEGIKNIQEIGKVPGLAALFIGSGGDLHNWIGVPSNSPEVETARQQILTGCKAVNIYCGISTGNKADTDKRLAEGWKMIRTGGAGG